MKMKTFTFVVIVAALFVSAKVQAVSVEQMLFESFIANYSRSYKSEPVTMRKKFKVFEVIVSYRAIIHTN